MKQYKVSFFQHYVSFPLCYISGRIIWRLGVFFDRLRRKITGRWYCAGCEAYHSGRVYAFSLDDFEGDGYCGLHLEAEHISKGGEEYRRDHWRVADISVGLYTFDRGGRQMIGRERKRLQESIRAEVTAK